MRILIHWKRYSCKARKQNTILLNQDKIHKTKVTHQVCTVSVLSLGEKVNIQN